MYPRQFSWLKEEGRGPLYIEQNHRPQILYTEADLEIMEEEWELTKAHREDLAGRPPTLKGMLS